MKTKKKAANKKPKEKVNPLYGKDFNTALKSVFYPNLKKDEIVR
jgi:hypothetical protein